MMLRSACLGVSVMVLSLVLLLACTHSAADSGASGDGGSPDGGSTDGGGTDGGGTDGGGTDGGGDSGTTAACPEGMVPVPPAAPVYCIDAYEVEVVDEVPLSLAGVIPTTAITYDQAVASCADHPVLDSLGKVLVPLHLATLQEWQDAGDNVVGEGGTAYPYGDMWQDDYCATPTADGTQVLDELVPTGSFPKCVSDFGVYDSVGNAWEWADPDLHLDQAAFLAAVEGLGSTLVPGADDTLWMSSGAVGSGWFIDVAGLGGTVSLRSVDGKGKQLVLTEPSYGPDTPYGGYRGYLRLDRDEVPVPPADHFLAIRIDPAEAFDDGSVPLHSRPDEDGQPIPAKMGCAHYTGNEGGCRLSVVNLNHTHDFNGTIGFRCASEPLPR